MRRRLVACMVGIVAAALMSAGLAFAAGRTVVPIGELRRLDDGSVVTVSGVVSDTGNFAAGFKVVIGDATGAVNVTLFSSLYDELAAPERLNVGARITVTGRLKEFKGALEIVPSRDRDLEVVGPAQPAASLVQPTGKVAAKVGARVTISGTIAAVQKFKLGVKLRVDDGSGPRWVTVFDSVLSRIRNADKLIAGQRVLVTGKVSVFRKTAEITPALPHDVRVLDARQ